MSNLKITLYRFTFYQQRFWCFLFFISPIMFILFLPLGRDQIIQPKIIHLIKFYPFPMYKPQTGFVWEVLTYV